MQEQAFYACFMKLCLIPGSYAKNRGEYTTYFEKDGCSM